MTINGRKQVLGAAAGLWLVCLSLLWAGLPARSAAQAGSAGAEVTALDIALIQPRAHPDDLRAVTLAFMSSEFHFVRQPDGAGGHELVLWQGPSGLPVLSIFDRPERLADWSLANFSDEEMADLTEMIVPAGELLGFLDQAVGGEIILNINPGQARSIQLGPPLVRYLAAASRLPAAADTAVETPPETALEIHIRRLARLQVGELDAWERDLAALFEGEYFFVPILTADTPEDFEIVEGPSAQQNEEDGAFAVEVREDEAGRPVYRMAIFDRQGPALAYTRRYAERYGATASLEIIQGQELQTLVPPDMVLVFNEDAQDTLDIIPGDLQRPWRQ